MTRFQFPLQRVMEWRALQVRSEEEKLTGMQQQHEALVLREKALTAAELNSEMGLLKMPTIDGNDLQALSQFQARIHTERRNLQVRRKHFEAQIVEQRKHLLKARRDHRVLEKLKETRWRTWTYLNDREIETIAAEAYMSKWIREMAP